jgi:hypothetical protein
VRVQHDANVVGNTVRFGFFRRIGINLSHVGASESQPLCGTQVA